MTVDAGLGYREGYTLLGSFRPPGGRVRLNYILVPTGSDTNPAEGSLNAWIQANPPWVRIRMVQSYEPSPVGRFPTRTAVQAGDRCSLPGVEVDALVAAGLAVNDT